METAHSFVTKHGIDTNDGQSIEVSINNWLFDKKKRGFKAAAIQWPRPPYDWGELGIMIVTSFVSGYRNLTETEKDSAIAGWLVELGVARNDLQWVTLSDNLRITLEGNLDPHKSHFIFRERYDPSLLKALHRTFFIRWWSGGILFLLANTLQTTTPLVNKIMLTWLTDSYVYYCLTDEQKAVGVITKPRGVGYGIGLVFALIVVQVASLLAVYYTMIAMVTGVSVRTALIGAIFRKSFRLSGRARLEHSVGKIMTTISADTAKLDRSAAFAHNLWITPMQIMIAVGLLIVGILSPRGPRSSYIQFMLVKIIFDQRKKDVKITDQRIRITTETSLYFIGPGICLIKYYAWESFYTQRVGELRTREIRTIRKIAIVRSGLIAMVTFTPILASILSFITYALSGHYLNIAIIFSSLQYFNIIHMPLVLFPIVLPSSSDATVALRRISKFLTAEELSEPYTIDYERKTAVEVDGDLTWETAGNPVDAEEKGKLAKCGLFRGANRKKPMLPTTTQTGEPGAATKEEETKADEKPFELKILKFKVPKGAFVAIVGRVGSGKSSLLQALIGEMRRKKGEQGADGNRREMNQLERWAKGISNILGAAYSSAEVVLLNDSLSAVDAYVGKIILQNCLLSEPLTNKARILVTHVLYILDKMDYIYVMEDFAIAEEGTDAARHPVVFSHLMEKYGNLEQEKQMDRSKTAKGDGAEEPDNLDKKADDLMQIEEQVL
ncbi:hypothetical protein PILCRDRAFT_16141 [Piloderma croceum F 1598]|uniref:ABC transmembrane type-1 domain-containing protein n=1 Tax=Piloderma croceum (strain F 1598) TaxID=765440 RepID=A0A0C3EXA9_PILCF|nr:hypothetical protein PILCRDRAFT_16141 [Piloderma croceum F 1598]